ncbi:hypothetical protein AZE42_07811 [Rhizopogon vesiculosus]|uniref:Uncharacterized protein n=1 Tax=Rhizopogon vesiculosus TaxID=180088 RepID=A0A1J8PKF3_9AGAM|nr:hypothetical protein AZE42_07811 [Rhizopogon vesiculosus]
MRQGKLSGLIHNFVRYLDFLIHVLFPPFATSFPSALRCACTVDLTGSDISLQEDEQSKK